MKARVGCVTSLVALAVGSAVAPDALSAQRVGEIRSWGYQLDGIEADRIARSGFDLVVIDHSADGSEERSFTRAEVEEMKRSPDGNRRRVIAYMSIGEAEDYRFYWRPEWVSAPPLWLDEENPDWPGNFKVRFWEATWQSVILGSPEAYLDRIVDAGFDGVYLDIIDAFEHYEADRAASEDDMVAFVRSISEYAKGRAGDDFMVIPQNGERLLERTDYMVAIDGIAKEDLFWGYDGVEAPSPATETAFSVAYLQRALDAGKLVLTVDYPPDRATIDRIYAESRSRGFVPYAAGRELDRLRINADLDPAGSVVESRRLPGQFFALTAPKGVARASLVVDRWSERSTYVAEDFGGPESAGEFTSRDFYEWTAGLHFGYGLTDRWEIGVIVPAVSGHFVRDPADGLPGLGSSFDESGLGNLRLFVSGSQSWLEGDANVLGALEFAPTTDSRGAPFGGGDPEVRLSLTAERYWGSVGLVGTVAGTSYVSSAVGESEVSAEASVGLGAQVAPRFFLSGTLARSGSNTRSEAAAEVILGARSSVEAFVGRDLAGPAEAAFFGFALNVWIGGGS